MVFNFCYYFFKFPIKLYIFSILLLILEISMYMSNIHCNSYLNSLCCCYHIWIDLSVRFTCLLSLFKVGWLVHVFLIILFPCKTSNSENKTAESEENSIHIGRKIIYIFFARWILQRFHQSSSELRGDWILFCLLLWLSWMHHYYKTYLQLPCAAKDTKIYFIK